MRAHRCDVVMMSMESAAMIDAKLPPLVFIIFRANITMGCYRIERHEAFICKEALHMTEICEQPRVENKNLSGRVPARCDTYMYKPSIAQQLRDIPQINPIELRSLGLI
jgi:hypothetical protein